MVVTKSATAFYHSPIGLLEIEADDSALLAVRFSKKKSASKDLKTNHPILKKTLKQLEEYFSGKRRVFDIPLSFSGSDFQTLGRRGLSAIAYGKTETYGSLAKKIGRSGAARAIGTVCSSNPHPIIVPCHRVLGANKKFSYAGGSAIKKWLLAHEGVMLE